MNQDTREQVALSCFTQPFLYNKYAVDKKKQTWNRSRVDVRPNKPHNKWILYVFSQINSKINSKCWNDLACDSGGFYTPVEMLSCSNRLLINRHIKYPLLHSPKGPLFCAFCLLFPPLRQPSTLSLKARHTTAFWWPLYSLLISPVSTHQSRARLSDEAVGNKIIKISCWLTLHIYSTHSEEMEIKK